MKKPRSVTRRQFVVVAGLAIAGASSAVQSADMTPKAKSVLGARRVVTGHDANNKSIFVQTGPAPRVVAPKTGRGFAMVEMWATDSPPALPVTQGDPTTDMKAFIPPLTGSRFRLVEFPQASRRRLSPEAQRKAADAFHQEFLLAAPDLANAGERDNPGMHTTDSVDYGIVISGEMTLELDDGATINLKPGDCIVQNGTRHRWINHGHRPCVMAFVLIGAARAR